MDDHEYKIISGKDEHVQKVLNQWKHQYWLEIIQFVAYVDNMGDYASYDSKVLLIRRRKKEHETAGFPPPGGTGAPADQRGLTESIPF